MNIREWLTLDKSIENQKILEIESESQLGRDIAEIHGEFLRELKQRRESCLRPVIDEFSRNSITDQYVYMESELLEINDEIFDCYIDVKVAVEKVVNLQMSCETMLCLLGLNEQQRMEVRNKVINKNEKRGYYNG